MSAINRNKPCSQPAAQATNCASCGEYRPTPLRNDTMGGYVCLTCIDKELARLQSAEPTEEQIDRVAEALKAEFRRFNPQWFVNDVKNDGPCDITPWNLLALAALKAVISRSDLT